MPKRVPSPIHLRWSAVNALGRGVEHGLRGCLHAGQQIGIADQVRDLELHEPGLARAEQLPGPAQLEVAARDFEAVGSVAQDPEALACERRERRPIEKDAGALDRPAPDAAAQLVQLRESHALGVLDDHQARVRHVDPDLDDRGRDQQVEAPVLERGHRPCPCASRASGRAPARWRDPAERRRAPRRSRSRPGGAAAPIPRSAGRPSTPAGPRCTRLRMRSMTSSRRVSGSATVRTGVRPGGSSSITDTSRSA